MPDAIQASFGLDLNPLKKGFAEAENIARAGGRKVAGVLDASVATASRGLGQTVPINWSNVFPRQGFDEMEAMRRRRNSGSAFPPAPPDKYPKPEDDDGGGRGRGGFFTRSDIGIGRGLTLLLAVREAANVFKEVNNQASELEAHINEITRLTGSGAFRGAAEMESNLKEASAALAEIQKRRDSELHQEGSVMGFFAKGVRKGRQFLTGDSDENEQGQLARLRNQAGKDVVDLAEKQRELNKAEKEGLEGSEREAALLKQEITFRERLGAIAERAAKSGVKDTAGAKAEVEKDALEKRAINQRFDLKGREEELQNRILNLQGQGLSKDQEGIRILKERIAAKKQELSTNISAEQKTHIGTEIHGLENQLFSDQYDDSKKSNSQKLSERIEASEFQSFIRHSQGLGTTPNAYVRSPDAYNSTIPTDNDPWMRNGRPYRSQIDSGSGGQGGSNKDETTSAVIQEIQGLRADMRSYWQ